MRTGGGNAVVAPIASIQDEGHEGCRTVASSCLGLQFVLSTV